MHARIQIYWCTSSIFRHLKLELLTKFPASNDEKYINVVYIWRKFVSFYGYVHWRMTTEISVMYGSEKVNPHNAEIFLYKHWRQKGVFQFKIIINVLASSLHLKTYAKRLRPLEIFLFFQSGDILYTSESDVCLSTSESDVYRRRILTYKNGPRAERVNQLCCWNHIYTVSSKFQTSKIMWNQ